MPKTKKKSGDKRRKDMKVYASTKRQRLKDSELENDEHVADSEHVMNTATPTLNQLPAVHFTAEVCSGESTLMTRAAVTGAANGLDSAAGIYPSCSTSCQIGDRAFGRVAGTYPSCDTYGPEKGDRACVAGTYPSCGTHYHEKGDRARSNQENNKNRIIKNSNNIKYSNNEYNKHCTELNRSTEVIPEVVAICGNFNQGSSLFSQESQGRQCTCNALVMLTHVIDDAEITSDTIDSVLLEGDVVYNRVVNDLKKEGKFVNALLKFDELPSKVKIYNEIYEVNQGESIVGVVLPSFDNDVLTLDSAIDSALEISNTMLVMIGSLTSAIFYKNNTYHFFDSHSHDNNGLSSADGKAVLMKFKTVNSLVQYMYQYCESVNLLDNVQFEIMPLGNSLKLQNTCEKEIMKCTPECMKGEVMLKTACNDSVTSHGMSINEKRQALLQKKRQQEKKRYENQDYRLKKMQSTKSSYRESEQYRLKKIQTDKMKYSQNKQYRLKKIHGGKEKYREAEQYRLNMIQTGKEKYRENEQYRLSMIQTGKEKYRENEQYRLSMIQTGKEKYKENEEYRHNMKKYSKKKYQHDLVHKANIKNYSIRKYNTDVVHRKKVKLVSIMRYKLNPHYRQALKHANAKRYLYDKHFQQHLKECLRKTYRTNKQLRMNILTKRRQRYYSDPVFRRARLEYKKQKRVEERKSQRSVISRFRKEVSEGLKYACCVCDQLLFRKQVMICEPDGYNKKGLNVSKVAKKCINDKHMHKCMEQCEEICNITLSCKGKLWICFGCHRKLLQGKIPAEAAVNNLSLQPIPKDLDSLNDLERQLIALRIPFLKLVSLPKGGQFGVHGPVTCVASDVKRTSKALPLSENVSSLIRVKLKRKLSYKGHQKYRFISTKKVEKAFRFLKENNIWYKDITLDDKWENPVNEQTTKDSIGTNEFEDANDGDSESINVDENEQSEVELDDQEKLNGMLMDTCLQPIDIGQEVLDQHFDDILCVAPCEGNNPISMLKEKGNEEMTFPVQLPDGTNGLMCERPEKLTMSRYFHSRLRNADNRFAKDTSYIFYAQYLSELHQVISNVSIALRQGTTKDGMGRNLTAKMLTDKESIKGLLNSDHGYRFLKPVRGTPPYWQATLKDLFAMIRQLGIPTWFCSFSAADMRWPEVIDTILEHEGSDKRSDDLDWNEKCEVLRSNPITDAIMFNHRFQTFLRTVILSDLKPIGNVDDRFHRIEFQQRGSPHTHCLFWDKDAPVVDKDSDEAVCSFIDQYVSCKLPSEDDDPELHEIVASVQQHSKNHSKSCKKKGTTCRFNFPRPPSMKTFISRPKPLTEQPIEEEPPQASIENAKATLDKVWCVINNTDDFEISTTHQLFSKAGISQEDFQNASDILTKKKNIVLKREPDSLYINNYNPLLLRCWNANMDIQYITDAYACVMYVVSYISKAEREMGIVLEQTRAEAIEGNLDAKETMKKIGRNYLHQREVSAQEAAFRVCNLPLKECSRKVQFIPVGDNPVKMSLPLNVIRSKSNCDDEHIWMTTLIERYRNRPDNNEFTSMSLAQFASDYRVLAKSEVPRDMAQKSKTVFQLQNNMGFVQKRTRTKPAVIRYPRFSAGRNPEQYYQSILQLFLPHRSESQLKPIQFKSFEEFHSCGAVKISETSDITPVCEIVKGNMEKYEKHAQELEDAQSLANEVGPLEDAWASMCPETEAERLECLSEKQRNVNDNEDNCDDIPDLSKKGTTNTAENCLTELRKKTITVAEAEPLMQKMNKKQKEVFYKVRQWCLDKRNGKFAEPFHLLITGGAGTGKSHLIKCLHFIIQKTLGPSSPNPDDTVVMLTAPTGTAAFNIGGTTIHSALKIVRISKHSVIPLGEEQINTLRSKLENLQILIIDEISMVGHDLLNHVHERLRQIKHSNQPFGGVSVIAVGDFYQLQPVKATSLCKEDPRDFSQLWETKFQITELDEIMRQKNDSSFAEMLNRLRIRQKKGPLLSDDIKMLKTCENHNVPGDSLHIFPSNVDVTDHNNNMLKQLCPDYISVAAEDFEKDPRTGRLKRTEIISLKTDCLPGELLLGKEARVMLTRNIDISDGLVNGVMGTVKDILPSISGTKLPIVRIEFDNKQVGISQKQNTKTDSNSQVTTVDIKSVEENVRKGVVRHQLPLTLAWASTIHKVQGLTTDKLVVSFEGIFSAGMAYVALSRVSSIQGLRILNFDEKYIYASPTVSEALGRMSPYISTSADENIMHDPCIHLLLHNIQGLNPHFKDLKSNEDIHEADFVCLTETWLNEDTHIPNLNEFQFCHKTRSDSYSMEQPTYMTLKQQAHGGVGVYYRNFEKYNPLSFGCINMEYIAFHVEEIDTIVVVIYRPDTYTTSLFLQNMERLIHSINSFPNKPCIIMGDFNLSGETGSLVNLMKTHKFNQLINEPTTESGTLIDHVYVKGLTSLGIRIIPTYYSHHEMISIKIPL